MFSPRAAQKRHQLLLLLLPALLAAALPTALAAPLDVPLPLGDGVYNPSLAVHAGHAYVVARATRLRWDTSGLKWIVNRAYLCAWPLAEASGGGGSGGNNNSTTPPSLPSSLSWLPDAEAEMAAAELDALAVGATSGGDAASPLPPPRRRCVPLDPWAAAAATPYVECRASPSSGRDPWDATGVDDTKLFAWPGRGLWAVTGRRPQAVSASSSASSSSSSPQRALLAESSSSSTKAPRWPPERRCPQPVVWRQFLFRLAAEGEPVDLGALAGDKRLSGSGGSNSNLRGPPQLPDLSGYAWAADPLKYRPFGVSEGWWGKGGNGGGGNEDGGGNFWPLFEPLQAGEAGEKQQQEQVAMMWRRRRRRGGGGERRRRRRRKHRRPAAALAAAAADADSNNPTDYRWELTARSPPLQLSLSDAFAVYGRGYDVYEKNWMPMALPPKAEEAPTPTPLYVVHSLHPYRVYRVEANGTTVPVHSLEVQQATEMALREGLGGGGEGGPVSELLLRVHGGPPVIYYAPRNGKPRLLGVLHYWLPRSKGGSGRTYHHRLFFAAAAPPPTTTSGGGGGEESAPAFAVERVARQELPLRMDGVGGEGRRGRQRGGTYASVAFASGLHHDKGGGGGTGGGGGGGGGGEGDGAGAAAAVVVTYGSGDSASRALVLTEGEVEAMFA